MYDKHLGLLPPMAAMTPDFAVSTPEPASSRAHRVQHPRTLVSPAMSKGLVLDLNEIIDISEDGCVSAGARRRWSLTKSMLCALISRRPHPDLYNRSGDVVEPPDAWGLRFVHLPSRPYSKLRDWLFVNALASAVTLSGHCTALAVPGPSDPAQSALLPDYTNHAGDPVGGST